MTISAKIVADSIHATTGKRLTTFELRYPRFIHAEELTHRLLHSSNGDMIEVIHDGLMYDKNLSRNASSSRAIPVERMIQDVIDDPAMPIHWGKNQPGMHAKEEHDELVEFANDKVPREIAWLRARDVAIQAAERFAKAGYHKQIVNRLLEPWLHINVVVTATELENFFKLRIHKDAQPEIHNLALKMTVAMEGSTPRKLFPGEWHLPYVNQDPGPDSDMVFAYATEHDMPDVIEPAKMLSVARCASVSYKTVDGKPMTMERAAAIYDKLVKADVFHASPFEHQATPDDAEVSRSMGWRYDNEFMHGNFVGWISNRKLMENNFPL